MEPNFLAFTFNGSPTSLQKQVCRSRCTSELSWGESDKKRMLDKLLSKLRGFQLKCTCPARSESTYVTRPCPVKVLQNPSDQNHRYILSESREFLVLATPCSYVIRYEVYRGTRFVDIMPLQPFRVQDKCRHLVGDAETGPRPALLDDVRNAYIARARALRQRVWHDFSGCFPFPVALRCFTDIACDLFVQRAPHSGPRRPTTAKGKLVSGL